MTRQQRFKYEMFVRVRDFGVAHAALLPEGTMGGRALARVAAAVAEIDEHLKDHVLGRSDARRVKAETRDAVYEYLKTLAEAARRVTRAEPGVSPFRLPRYRSLRAELATARAFLEEASSSQAAFESFGLPPTFIDDLRDLVRQLQEASDIVDRLLREFEISGGRWWEAEVHRLRGDIMRLARRPLADVAACYEAAANVARRQGARMWELRAMRSLTALREDGAANLAVNPSAKI